ncbi:MAG: TonB family protein [Nitrosomonadales bacterium]|nr:TonB family protein [Nitrosomonadales bacterium]
MSAMQDPVDLPLHTRLLVVALVALAHGLLMWSWIMLPSLSRPVRHEMSVSVTLPAPPQPAPPEPKPAEPKPPEPPKPKPKPVVKPKPVKPQPAPQAAVPDVPEETPPQEEAPPPEETSSAPPQPAGDPPAPASPVREPDREPDYRAAYLKNPAPSYPMVARRMGWQGKVVLNVEVLANGLPGQIKLHQSSGHDVLDNAAIKAVSGWRFVAARQGGQVVTKSFLVPIPFILKED